MSREQVEELLSMVALDRSVQRKVDMGNETREKKRGESRPGKVEKGNQTREKRIGEVRPEKNR